MTEFFILFAGFSVIIGLPICLTLYFEYRKEHDDIKKIGLDVKNKLVKSNSYSEISLNTLILIKNGIIKNFIVKISLYLLILGIYIFCMVQKEELLYFVPFFAVMFDLLAIKTIYDIQCISRPEKLTKIIGFVFREKGHRLSIIYYDLQNFKYKVFSYNKFFTNADFAVPGKFVNLIGVRKKSKIRIIRLLSF